MSDAFCHPAFDSLSSEGGALDLHVLGLPPAFALSQDQTLKLDENLSRQITTFDEVPLPSRGRDVPVRFDAAPALALSRQGC